ncbi:MAG: hypothetical protein HYV33_06295 [Candidatus Kerfeldbacteria bacterium]|nr:hypothetical protein [Candidatus Kerfeldbacteria bacterium]
MPAGSAPLPDRQPLEQERPKIEQGKIKESVETAIERVRAAETGAVEGLRKLHEAFTAALTTAHESTGVEQNNLSPELVAELTEGVRQIEAKLAELEAVVQAVEGRAEPGIGPMSPFTSKTEPSADGAAVMAVEDLRPEPDFGTVQDVRVPARAEPAVTAAEAATREAEAAVTNFSDEEDAWFNGKKLPSVETTVPVPSAPEAETGLPLDKPTEANPIEDPTLTLIIDQAAGQQSLDSIQDDMIDLAVAKVATDMAEADRKRTGLLKTAQEQLVAEQGRRRLEKELLKLPEQERQTFKEIAATVHGRVDRFKELARGVPELADVLKQLQGKSDFEVAEYLSTQPINQELLKAQQRAEGWMTSALGAPGSGLMKTGERWMNSVDDNKADWSTRGMRLAGETPKALVQGMVQVPAALIQSSWYAMSRGYQLVRDRVQHGEWAISADKRLAQIGELRQLLDRQDASSLPAVNEQAKNFKTELKLNAHESVADRTNRLLAERLEGGIVDTMMREITYLQGELYKKQKALDKASSPDDVRKAEQELTATQEKFDQTRKIFEQFVADPRQANEKLAIANDQVLYHSETDIDFTAISKEMNIAEQRGHAEMMATYRPAIREAVKMFLRSKADMVASHYKSAEAPTMMFDDGLPMGRSGRNQDSLPGAVQAVASNSDFLFDLNKQGQLEVQFHTKVDDRLDGKKMILPNDFTAQLRQALQPENMAGKVLKAEVMDQIFSSGTATEQLGPTEATGEAAPKTVTEAVTEDTGDDTEQAEQTAETTTPQAETATPEQPLNPEAQSAAERTAASNDIIQQLIDISRSEGGNDSKNIFVQARHITEQHQKVVVRVDARGNIVLGLPTGDGHAIGKRLLTITTEHDNDSSLALIQRRAHTAYELLRRPEHSIALMNVEAADEGDQPPPKADRTAAGEEADTQTAVASNTPSAQQAPKVKAA